MYHRAPVRSAPITNAANAMPITVRVSRPWKTAIRKGSQYSFSESAPDVAILYLFHKHCQESWARTKKMRTKWESQPNAMSLKLAHFFSSKEKWNDQISKTASGCILSLKMLWKMKWAPIIEMWCIASYSSNTSNNETRKHRENTFQIIYKHIFTDIYRYER